MARCRLFACFAALALVVAACGGSAGETSTTTTTSSARPATTTPGGGSSSSLANNQTIRAQIDELMIEAQQLRGLEFIEPVDVVLLTDQEYTARLLEVFDEDLSPEDVAAFNALYRLLGVIGPEEDFRQLLETLYTSGTAGFYRPETGELVVRVVGDELRPYSQSAVVHELVHALQDQHFDLLDDLEDIDGDSAYVAQAIIEGDATLRDTTYALSLSAGEQARYFAEYAELAAALDLSAFEALPGYIRNAFQALYTDGYAFSQAIGIDAIDDQFTDPPESSEQLLDPEKYRRDEQPRPVTLPDFDLPGYELWFEAPAGQKDLELMLTDGVGIDRAQEAAAGWGGDLNRIYHAGDQEAVYVLRYLGDSKVDTEQLEAAFVDYIAEMVPTSAFTLVERDADELLVIIASDSALGPQLEAAFSP